MRQTSRTIVAHLLAAVKAGGNVTQVAARLDISESTATRILRAHRAKGAEVNVRRGRPPRPPLELVVPVKRVARAPAAACANIDEVISVLLSTPFPYPPAGDNQEDIARLCAVPMRLDGNDIRPMSIAGLRLCRSFFPNRYNATSKGQLSARAAWSDEAELRKAVAFQLRYGDPITPPRVLRAITMRCRTPTIFRPAVAKFICERYCPPGGRVWDPCAGYGGRLLGAHAAGVHYLGTDVDPATVAGNQRLAQAVNAVAEVRRSPAEVFVPGFVDLVFTSPPYFDRERYSDGVHQSWRAHGASLTAWVAGFLQPVAERAYGALPAKGCLVLNIADLRERGQVIPLVERTINAAIAAGFHHRETLHMPLAAINRRSPFEPVLVFQK